MFIRKRKLTKWLHLAIAVLVFVSAILPSSLFLNSKTAKAAISNNVVISQVYAAGGGAAIFDYKFIELYNPTKQDIDLTGWTIQYSSAGGVFQAANSKPLSGTIKAYGYYLLKGASTGSSNANVINIGGMTFDANPGLNTAAGAGKIALSKSNTVVTGSSDPNVVDFLGYGTGSSGANDSLGAVFAGTSFTTGTITRKSNSTDAIPGKGNGWDTRNNATDFKFNSGPTFNIHNSLSPLEAPDDSEGGGTPQATPTPVASKITYVRDASDNTRGIVTGEAGAVTGGAIVKAYATGQTIEATATASGAFSMSVPNADTNLTIQVSATLDGRTESAKVQISLTSPDSISTIASIRINDANGSPTNQEQTYTVEGVVTMPNGLIDTKKSNFYIQDATGGINIYSTTLAPPTGTKLGDKLRVKGKILFYQGLTEFDAISIEKIGEEQVPAPKSLTIAELNTYATAEPNEGILAKISGKITSPPAVVGSAANITIADANNKTLTVRVTISSGIDYSTALVANQSYEIVGIIGQNKSASPYTSGYQIFPRYASDITAELTLSHTAVTQAYEGIDLTITATASNAESVNLYYREKDNQGSFTMIPFTTTDHMHYSATIDKSNLTSNGIEYYIEAKASTAIKLIGSADTPLLVKVDQYTLGPQFTQETPFNTAEIESKRPEISVKMFDLSGVVLSSVSIKIDGVDVTNQAAKLPNLISYTPISDLSISNHTVEVSAMNNFNISSNYTWSFTVIPTFDGGNHYRGTTHNHTNISHDGKGDPEQALLEAQKYGYDWFAFSDHSHDIDSALLGQDTEMKGDMPERKGGADWKKTKDLAAQYTKNGNFVVFPAFEMTSTTWGHSNVFGTENFIDRNINNKMYQDLSKYYAWVLQYDDIAAQFNHPDMSKNAFNNFTPYDSNVDKLFTMFEVGNGSGQYQYANSDQKYIAALDLGWHVAPTYGEDNHDGTWGQTMKRTVIVSKDLSQESLLQSMRNLHVYMTEDPNFTLDVFANDYYMGATVDSKTLNFKINGNDLIRESSADPKYSYLPKNYVSNDKIKKVEIISNGGKVIQSITPQTNAANFKDNDTSFEWKPTVQAAGSQQWYVVKVTQEDGDRVYSSPIWSQQAAVDVKVSGIEVVGDAIIGGNAAQLKAGISNLGSTDVSNLKVGFYYDQIVDSNQIGISVIPSLPAKTVATATVTWNNPVVGNHQIIATLIDPPAGDDLTDNVFILPFTIKPPLGLKIMIDAKHKNENTSTDSGTYKDNLNSMTSILRKEGYTVVENTSELTANVLSGVEVLMISHPGVSLTANEKTAVAEYVKSGGSLMLTEKSNNGSTNPTINNDLLQEIGSSIQVNNDGVFDASKAGNFWTDPIGTKHAVRAHPTPFENNYLMDLIPAIDYFSGSSLKKGSSGKLMTEGKVTVLVSGNKTSYQDNAKTDTVDYNLLNNRTPGENITGGDSIPLIASEELYNGGKIGRIIVSGMNILNDKQLDESYESKGNTRFTLSAFNWLANRDVQVTKIQDARNKADDTELMIQGTVTTSAGVFFDAFYLQDETGGIMAFNDVPDKSVTVGDTVRVYGHTKTFENNKELEFGQFDKSVVKVNKIPGTPLEPKEIVTKDLHNEQYHGLLVKITGEVKSHPNEDSYIVDDGSGEAIVFIDGYIVNQSGPVPAIQIGDTLEAVGLAGMFSGGERIRVRDTKELKVTPKQTVGVTGVELDETNFTLTSIGSTKQLHATVLPTNATNKAVTWSTNKPEIAKVNEYGEVTAVNIGEAEITVTTVDGGFTATSKVTVEAGTTSPISVIGVELDETDLTLTGIGSSKQLHATVLPADATNKAVTWTTNKPEIAKVNEYGEVTAVNIGEAVITVTTVDGGFTATSTVTVEAGTTSPISVIGVELDETDL
ncbi:Ig domain-containing protein group 2 domain-containing protein, partial [Paenibacillus albiflavus]